MEGKSDNDQAKAQVAEAGRKSLLEIQEENRHLNAAVQIVSETDEVELHLTDRAQTPAELCREECKRIGLGEVGTTHNQASSPTHHGRSGPTALRKRELYGRDDDVTTESSDRDNAEETRRRETKALWQKEPDERVERIEGNPGNSPRPRDKIVRNPRLTREPEEDDTKLVECQEQLTEPKKEPDEIYRLEQGAARRPFPHTNESYYRPLEGEDGHTTGQRPRARLERRVEEYLNESESEGEYHFFRNTWTLVIVAAVICLLGFATVVINEYRRRQLTTENVFHQGGERNETDIAQAGWNTTVLGRTG